MTPRAKVVDQPTDVKPWVLVTGGALTAAAIGIGVLYTVRSNADKADADRILASLEQGADPSVVASKSICSATSTARPAECDSVATKLSDGKSARNIETASFITAGVLGLATVGAFLFWPSSDEKRDAAKISVGPWTEGRGHGVVVSGAF